MNQLSTNRLPPSASLKALQVAAHHRSFTRAAEELNVTQSAISHQIRALENFWDVKLFERLGRGLRLTAAGEALVPVVARFFDDLSGTLGQLRQAPERTALRISTVQSFAIKWLVPRLNGFQAEHPDIDVWVSTSEDFVAFRQAPGGDSVDAAIRLCACRFSDLDMTPLLREEVFPVCSPAFIARWGKPARPEDLRRLPLLLRHQDRGAPTWQDWFAHIGIGDMPLDQGIRYSESAMAIQVALEGHGIALARSAHVFDALRRGDLVRLFDIPYPSPLRYYFACHKDRAHEPAIRAFRTWVVAAAKVSQAGYTTEERGQ